VLWRHPKRQFDARAGDRNASTLRNAAAMQTASSGNPGSLRFRVPPWWTQHWPAHKPKSATVGCGYAT
jgi:hypothetical protein